MLHLSCVLSVLEQAFQCPFVRSGDCGFFWELNMAERKIFLRKAYNYDMDAVSAETGLRCEDESLTAQEYAEDADINVIAQRFGLFGELPTGVRAPVYGDFSGVDDYQSALNAIMAAQEAFMELPGDVRARFENDPARFVDFCSDERNREEASKLGLVVPKAEELVRREPAPVVEQAAPAPSVDTKTG